jgi:XTP/dITP diphosphohydrolase
MRILAATGNKGKLREIREIIENENLIIISPEETGLKVDILEDGNSFEENAIKKALALRHASGMNVLADDSGLCVDALGGMPGVISARFSSKDATDDKNISKLLNLMEGKKDRKAKFVCVLALALTDGRIITASGECPGIITTCPIGTGGFGYDPVFLDPGSRLTFAELSQEEKNKISHRRKALEELKIILKDL